MNRRIVTPLAGLVATVAVLGVAVELRAQSPGEGSPKAGPAAKTTSKRGTPKHTQWGDPDLQGTWDYRTITPLERPQNMGDRQFLTDAEAAQLEARAAKRLDEPPDSSVPANTIHAPYWTDPGRRVVGDKRNSLIIDPPDGRLPALTAEGQLRLATGGRGGTGGREGGKADGPEDRSPLERCIPHGPPTSNLPTLDDKAIGVEITVEDPGAWARPWTAALTMRPSEGPIFEYACHEANLGLKDILEVARDEDEKAQKAADVAARRK